MEDQENDLFEKYRDMKAIQFYQKFESNKDIEIVKKEI